MKQQGSALNPQKLRKQSCFGHSCLPQHMLHMRACRKHAKSFSVRMPCANAA